MKSKAIKGIHFASHIPIANGSRYGLATTIKAKTIRIASEPKSIEEINVDDTVNKHPL